MRRGVLALAVIAFALAGCGSSHGISLPCKPQPQGALCLKVFTSKGKVTDVIGYFSASASPLTGKFWRLALGWGRSASAPTRARYGNPPAATFCKDSQGNTVTTGDGCNDTLAAFYASGGDFAGLRVPVGSLPNPVCLREELRSYGEWVAGPAKRVCWPS
jgi:hypothetical protein